MYIIYLLFLGLFVDCSLASPAHRTNVVICVPFERSVGNGYRVNILRPRQNGRRFADDTFKRIFLNENVRISLKISLKFVPRGQINNPALVQIIQTHFLEWKF